MSNTRKARYLEALLEQRAPGSRFAVTWDQAPHRDYPWCWCVDWQDGPTLAQVQAWVHELAAAVAPLNVAALYLSRRLSARAWAVQLVRYVTADGSLSDPLAVRFGIEDRMAAMASPEVATDDREAARADALVRLAGPREENRMLDLLAAYGLAALDAEGELPPGVTRLRPQPHEEA